MINSTRMNRCTRTCRLTLILHPMLPTTMLTLSHLMVHKHKMAGIAVCCLQRKRRIWLHKPTIGQTVDALYFGNEIECSKSANGGWRV